jgi:hypothetical protein
MDERVDAQLRLAAQRHPAASRGASRPTSVHYAHHQLEELAGAFIVLMSGAGNPGARPFPPPAGRHRWPRNHPARNALGWPVPVAVEPPFQCWIDTTGGWWLIRLSAGAGALDAHPVGAPLREVGDLSRYVDGLDRILETYDLL